MAEDRIRLDGRTALCIGAGRGMGRQIAHTLSERGAFVVIGDVIGENAAQVAKEIKDAGRGASSAQIDVSDLAQVQKLVDGTIKDRGKLDILVNIAAIIPHGLFVDSKPEEWRKCIDVTFFGVVNAASAVLPHMIENRYGRIVSIASDAGRVGEKREAVYSGAKGAVIAFSKAIAKEGGRFNITVNCVSPGMTMSSPQASEMMAPRKKEMSPFYPLDRGAEHPPFGQNFDIAGAVAFLVSDDASWITGQTLSVNGGYSML